MIADSRELALAVRPGNPAVIAARAKLSGLPGRDARSRSRALAELRRAVQA
jgi:hypothetical protein